MNYGGFWIRTAALLLDTLFTIVPLSLLYSGFLWVLEADKYPTFMSTFSPKLTQEILMDPRDLWIQMISSLIFSIFYFFLLQGAMQGTPGKRILGLIIVTKSNKKPTYLQMLMRWIMTYPSGILLGLGYLTVGLSDKKQAWHDRVAGTFVIHTKLKQKKLAVRKAA